MPVSPLRAFSPSHRNRALPKSATLTCLASSKNILLGFKSRWITIGLWSCRYCIASAISRAFANLSQNGGRGAVLSSPLSPLPCSHSFSVVLKNSVTSHPWSGGRRQAPMSWSTDLWRCRDKVSSSWVKKRTAPSLLWKYSGNMHLTATSRPRHVPL